MGLQKTISRAPSLPNSQCWQERAVQTASGSTSSPEDTQGRGRGHRGSTKAAGQHADKQACSSPTPALTPPPINRPPPGFGHSMLEEGIRLPRTRVWSAVQLLLRASVRPLTMTRRFRGGEKDLCPLLGHESSLAGACRWAWVLTCSPPRLPFVCDLFSHLRKTRHERPLR